jgi:hypothetical protein
MSKHSPSHKFDLHRVSDHTEAKRLLSIIWNIHFKRSFGTGRRGPKPKSPARQQFNVVMLNLYAAWKIDPKLPLAVEMGDASFKPGSRYNALHLSKLVPQLIRHLDEEGLIKRKRGSQWSGLTRITPTEELINQFRQAGLNIEDIVVSPRRESIILRRGKDDEDETTKDIDYKTEPRWITKARQDLRKYNKLLEASHIGLPHLTEHFLLKKDGTRIFITSHHRFVRRVFSRGSWDYGGRYYGGWWQGISKELRERIFINGNPTGEVDYKSIHPHLLYARTGSTPNREDIYSIDLTWSNTSSQQLRAWVKQLVLVAINASSEKKAYAAFRYDQPTGTRGKRLKDKQLAELLNTFKQENKAISKYLCSDQGISLMAEDSRIATYVINKMTKNNIPVLCVHDSFVIDIENIFFLKQVMMEAAAEITGRDIPQDLYDDYLPTDDDGNKVKAVYLKSVQPQTTQYKLGLEYWKKTRAGQIS